MNIFHYFAISNKIINERLFEPLTAYGNDGFIKQTNCYYGSIAGICDHIYVADVVFLRDMAISLGSPVKNDPLFEMNHKYLVREITTLTDYIAKRKYLDTLIVKFVNQITSDDLERTVHITTNLAGDKTPNQLYIVLSHYFNHEIHHRGHISQILDEVGIENDISDMYSLE